MELEYNTTRVTNEHHQQTSLKSPYYERVKFYLSLGETKKGWGVWGGWWGIGKGGGEQKESTGETEERKRKMLEIALKCHTSRQHFSAQSPGFKQEVLAGPFRYSRFGGQGKCAQKKSHVSCSGPVLCSFAQHLPTQVSSPQHTESFSKVRLESAGHVRGNDVFVFCSPMSWQ